MRFTAIDSTSDGRLTRGKVYEGGLTHMGPGMLRVVIFDNKREWMTFDPAMFVPLGEYAHDGVPLSGAQ